jgi:hypothetical protein
VEKTVTENILKLYPQFFKTEVGNTTPQSTLQNKEADVPETNSGQALKVALLPCCL